MPIRENFTKSFLESINPPLKGRLYIYDTRVNGLVISVTPSGTKSFLVYRKLKGKPLRVTLGRFPDLPLERARKLAEKTLGDIAEGLNPIKERRAAEHRGVTLKMVFDDYLASRSHSLSKNTISNYSTIMNSHLADWLNKPLSEITRDQVEAKHRKLSERSHSSANKTMRVLRALFNYAHGKYENESGRGLFPDNPVARLTHVRAWNKETRRTNRIANTELPAWFEAVQALSQSDSEYNQTASDYFIFILLNGLRRREAASLKFDDVSFEDKVFTINQTKNKKPISLPMTDYVEQMLRRRKEVVESEFVFPGRVGSIDDPRRQIAQVREMSGVDFTLHDLRRTFITVAESLDISAYAVKALVNHSVGSDVTAGYIIMDAERLRGPMVQISEFILRAAGVLSDSASGIDEP